MPAAAKESQMPKLKTKSGAKKRFKVTASGIVLYQQSRKRHGMIKRTKKQIRQLRGTAVLFKTDGDKIKKYYLPNARSPALCRRRPPAPHRCTLSVKELSHGTRQARRHRARQTQESLEGRQGLLRSAQEHHSHRQAGGGEGKPIRLSRPQAPQAHLSGALDPAPQCRGAPVRADLQPLHRRPRQGRAVGRPQGAVRSGDPRARGLCGDRREGQSRNRGVRIERTQDGRRRRWSLPYPSFAVRPANQAMIDLGYVQCMARYNRWQNANLYGAADTLSDAERRRDRGASFGPTHAPVNHLLGADRIWMSRLAGPPRPDGGIPQSVSLHGDWDELKRERKAFDAVVIEWADRLDAASLAGELAYYSGAIKRELRKPKWLLV